MSTVMERIFAQAERNRENYDKWNQRDIIDTLAQESAQAHPVTDSYHQAAQFHGQDNGVGQDPSAATGAATPQSAPQPAAPDSPNAAQGGMAPTQAPAPQTPPPAAGLATPADQAQSAPAPAPAPATKPSTVNPVVTHSFHPGYAGVDETGQQVPITGHHDMQPSRGDIYHQTADLHDLQAQRYQYMIDKGAERGLSAESMKQLADMRADSLAKSAEARQKGIDATHAEVSEVVANTKTMFESGLLDPVAATQRIIQANGKLPNGMNGAIRMINGKPHLQWFQDSPGGDHVIAGKPIPITPKSTQQLLNNSVKYADDHLSTTIVKQGNETTQANAQMTSAQTGRMKAPSEITKNIAEAGYYDRMPLGSGGRGANDPLSKLDPYAAEQLRVLRAREEHLNATGKELDSQYYDTTKNPDLKDPRMGELGARRKATLEELHQNQMEQARILHKHGIQQFDEPKQEAQKLVGLPQDKIDAALGRMAYISPEDAAATRDELIKISKQAQAPQGMQPSRGYSAPTPVVAPSSGMRPSTEYMSLEERAKLQGDLPKIQMAIATRNALEKPGLPGPARAALEKQMADLQKYLPR